MLDILYSQGFFFNERNFKLIFGIYGKPGFSCYLKHLHKPSKNRIIVERFGTICSSIFMTNFLAINSQSTFLDLVDKSFALNRILFYL